MQHVALTMRDGSLAVMVLTEDADAAVVETEISKAAFDVLSWREVQPGDFPTSRSYRDAWVDRGRDAGIAIDMPRARGIMRTRLRSRRAALFGQLDTDYLRADEMGDAAMKTSIVNKKRALREAPGDPRIDTVSTTEELDALLELLLKV